MTLLAGLMLTHTPDLPPAHWVLALTAFMLDLAWVEVIERNRHHVGHTT
jgi:hypothetical protein